MIVRLKDSKLDRSSIEANLFQFYDSPIKRDTGYLEEALKNQFQFYDSPIKSHG